MGSIRAILGSRKVQAGGLVGGGVIVVSGISAVTNATDTIASVFAKAELIWRYAATPWLGVMVLCLSGFLIWRGIKDVARSQERGALADHIALALPTQIARLEAHFREFRDFEFEARTQIDAIATTISSSREYWGKPQSWGGVHTLPFEGFRGLNRDWRFVQPLADPAFLSARPITSQGTVQHSHLYDPAANSAFLQQLEHDFSLAEKWVDDARQAVVRERARAKAAEHFLDKRLAGHGD